MDLGPLNPDPRGLLALLGHRVSEEMLRDIAGADYGIERDKHYRELRRIASGEAPAPMGWCPKEVLELRRWRQPGDTEGHLERAFVCAALIRAAGDPQGVEFIGEGDTLAALVESAQAIGPDAAMEAGRLVAWRADRPSDIPGYFALAVAMLAVGLPDHSADWLERLGWWVIDQSKANGLGPPWVGYFGQRYEIWQRLALRMREAVEATLAGTARDVLVEVAGLIVA